MQKLWLYIRPKVYTAQLELAAFLFRDQKDMLCSLEFQYGKSDIAVEVPLEDIFLCSQLLVLQPRSQDVEWNLAIERILGARPKHRFRPPDYK